MINKKDWGIRVAMNRRIRSGTWVWTAFIILAGTTAHADVTFSDGVFSDLDWSASIVFEDGPPVSFLASQVGVGGNPDEYRRVSHSFGSPGNIITAHTKSSATYDPGTQGAVIQIDASFDLFLFDGGNSLVVAYGVQLHQNGSHYIAGFALTTTAAWTGHSFPGLVASNFGLVSGPGPMEPDFSASGAPFEVGFFASNGTDAGSTTTVSGIDNWSVTVVSVPSVPSLSGPAIGILILALGILGGMRAYRA